MAPASRLCSPSASLIPTHALNLGTLAPLDPKAENLKHSDHMPRLDCPSVSADRNTLTGPACRCCDSDSEHDARAQGVRLVILPPYSPERIGL